MIHFFRLCFITPGLIILWYFLYPWIAAVLAAQYLNNSFFRIGLLLFLTFWFYRYADGFFHECDSFKFLPLQIFVCGLRWLIIGVWNLLLPPFIGVSMYYGLLHYTDTPHWLTVVTSVFLFINRLFVGWIYPESRITDITNQVRFS